MAAGLDTRRPTSRGEWKSLPPYEPPNAMCEIDLNWRTIDGVPDLGGNAYRYSAEADITGIRTAPPPLGPHRYRQDRIEKKKVTMADPNQTKPPTGRIAKT